MASEQLEFLITQYLDGSLSAEQRAALEEQLKSDGEARALLEEHRKLDGILAQAKALPPINWEALAGRISQAVAQEEQAQRVYSIAWLLTARRLAMAACVLVATGVGIYLLVSHSPSGGLVPNMQARVDVKGPQAEVAGGAPVAEIQIGPPPGAPQSVYAENYFARPVVSLLHPDANGPADADRQLYQ